MLPPGYYLEILDVDSMNIFALTNLTDYYRKKGDFKNSVTYIWQNLSAVHRLRWTGKWPSCPIIFQRKTILLIILLN